jgi:hypothetical protein
MGLAGPPAGPLPGQAGWAGFPLFYLKLFSIFIFLFGLKKIK